jgi:hypothetical protein
LDNQALFPPCGARSLGTYLLVNGTSFAILRALGKDAVVIRINYAALRKDESESILISEELLRKAKKRLGFGARRELIGLLSSQLRLMAMEVAHRQMNPQSLYDAGVEGVLSALKVYDIGESDQSFKDFAMPFVKRAMQSEKLGPNR